MSILRSLRGGIIYEVVDAVVIMRSRNKRKPNDVKPKPVQAKLSVLSSTDVDSVYRWWNSTTARS